MFKILSRTSILSLFLIFTGAHVAQADSYLVSIKEPEGEITGYKCKDDQICRIKVLTLSKQIITAKIQFADKKALLLFKLNDNYLYTSTTHYAVSKSYIIDLEETECVKQKINLFKEPSGIDDGLMCRGSCDVVDLLIKICPAHG